MPKVKLWYSPGACSLSSHVLLHEIGVPFEAVRISVAGAENLTAEFARINPKKRVPVLSLDGEVITEVPAIATAIADLAPERHLTGRTALERARVAEWMNWLSGTLHAQGFRALWRPQQFCDEPAMFDGVRARGRRTIAECFEIIEAKLSGAYSTGGRFTAVDAFLLVFYRWGNGIGFDMPSAYPRYSIVARGLVQRDSVALALAAEGIGNRSLDDRVPPTAGGTPVPSSAKEKAA